MNPLHTDTLSYFLTLAFSITPQTAILLCVLRCWVLSHELVIKKWLPFVEGDWFLMTERRCTASLCIGEPLLKSRLIKSSVAPSTSPNAALIWIRTVSFHSPSSLSEHYTLHLLSYWQHYESRYDWRSVSLSVSQSIGQSVGQSIRVSGLSRAPNQSMYWTIVCVSVEVTSLSRLGVGD